MDLGLNLAEIEQKLDGHSIFAPSSSAMWVYCPGSLIPNLLAQDTAGYEAAEGTVGHSMAEKWLFTGQSPIKMLDTVVVIEERGQRFEIPVTTDMFEYIEEYVKWCTVLPGQHFIETRVDFSDITPIAKQSGTCDHAACEPGILTITDLKYGKGIFVGVKDNTQLIMYAYGFFRQYDAIYDFQEIVIRIAQPRMNNFDEITLTRQELLDWASFISKRAYAAWQPNAERVPGAKTCQWCKVKSSCSALAVQTERFIDGVFTDLDAEVFQDDMDNLHKKIDAGGFKLAPINPNTLTTQQMARLLPYRKLVESFFEQLQNELFSRMNNGEVVENYKLVEGRGSRDYVDAKRAEEELTFLGLAHDDMFTVNMVSPAQAEDKLRQLGYKRKNLPELLNSFVVTTKGQPTIAPLTDKRKPLNSSIEGVFQNIDDEL